MTAIEEMAGMDVLCSDKTGTLTLNKLTVDKNLIEVGLLVQFVVAFLTFLVFVLFQHSICIGLCKGSRHRYCCSDGSSSIPIGKSRCNRHGYSWNVG